MSLIPINAMVEVVENGEVIWTGTIFAFAQDNLGRGDIDSVVSCLEMGSPHTMPDGRVIRLKAQPMPAPVVYSPQQLAHIACVNEAFAVMSREIDAKRAQRSREALDTADARLSAAMARIEQSEATVMLPLAAE